jgi:hypothetical protein
MWAAVTVAIQQHGVSEYRACRLTDNGYNKVKSTGDFVLEDLTSYSTYQARC